MQITYYAGAADAAGTDSEQLDTSDTTAEQLVPLLSARHDGLAGVPEVLLVAGRRVAGHRPSHADLRGVAGGRVTPFTGG